MEIGFNQTPAPSKKTNGEDAIFISEDKRCFGVFDGVGEWANHGVNAREYSDKLSEGCSIAYNQNEMREPIEILTFASEHANETTGSSTATLVLLKEDYQLVAGHVGDCGIRVIRDKRLVFRSEEQQIEFNIPYQIGTRSDFTPSTHGLSYEVKVKVGDWVVVGSDGVFDNLYDSEIVNAFKKKKRC